MMDLIVELKNNLLADSDYVKYENIYKDKQIIDKELLIKLLNKHIDLYYIFLKMNIFVYGYDTKNLDKNLQDTHHYKGKDYRIVDIQVIFRLYYNNFSLWQKSMEAIIVFKLRGKSEINILKQILDRPVTKELRAFFEPKGVTHE